MQQDHPLHVPDAFSTEFFVLARHPSVRHDLTAPELVIKISHGLPGQLSEPDAKEDQAENEDQDQEGKEVPEDTSEENTTLPSVEKISGIVCNSGLSPDDLFKVAAEIIKHVVNPDTPQEQLIAYQKAIAELWPVQQDIQNEAEKHLANMKRAENSPNRLAA